MRVAVVGIGKMGLLHAGILNALEGVELCAMSDTSRYLLGMVKNLKPLPVYDDYQKMLDRERPDAAVIATPVRLHVPMMRECASRGVHFLVEKPLSLDAPEAESLVGMIAERGVVTQVGYMLRYVETFQVARSILTGGALGRLQRFRGTTCVAQLFRRGKGWRYSRQESGGGVVISHGTHLLDLLLWYFGEPARVAACTQRLYSEEVEDAAHGILEYGSGLAGWFDCSWSERHHRLLEIDIEVQGENGNLRVNDDAVKLYLDDAAGGFAAGWTQWKKPDLFEGVTIDIGGPQYTKQDEDFVRAVTRRGGVDSDVESAWKVQRLVDAIYRSAERGGEGESP
ncbi:MAG: Gfo/Idh/MocA family oxidoreductase [Candidatus Eisenbacteria bacterium]|nr:Gfo/Idh/MocA family oxidoreductase [Candidatus Eisenbacteria bacterium]